MLTSIKFNVIIPTRERADTLFHCLRTVVAQDYENLSIIVSDNFSQDNTKEIVDSFADHRIKYINTGKRVSMSHNWEFALSHVMDGWVMFLGDDDGLYPWALQTLNKNIQEYNVEAVSSTFGFFLWPGHFGYSLDGHLSIPLTTSVKLKRSRREIERVFSKGLSNTKLPWLYLGGAASIHLINRARDQNGRFFCSQIPDIYSAVALSFVVDKYLVIETPIVINGASKHSNGNAQMLPEVGNDEQPFLRFKSEDNIPFNKTLILGKSLQVILYECYLQAWHIHHGALGISLNDQLHIAIKVAPSEQLKDIQEECRMIATKNGFTFVEKVIPWKYKFRKLLSFMKRAFLDININPRQLNIVNVYDAVMASAYIYNFLQKAFCGVVLARVISFIRYSFWKIKRVTKKN